MSATRALDLDAAQGAGGRSGSSGPRRRTKPGPARAGGAPDRHRRSVDRGPRPVVAPHSRERLTRAHPRRVHRDRSSLRAGSRSARPGQRPLRRTRGPGTSFSSVRGADETTPSVSRSMVWSSTSLVMATALSRGHPPAAPGRPRRRGSPSVHRPQSPKRTIRINRAGGRRRVQQVSGCRRVRRQAEAR